VTLDYPGGEHQMPIVKAILGSPAINLSTLRAKTGMVSLDPGLVNTALCTSTLAGVGVASAALDVSDTETLTD